MFSEGAQHVERRPVLAAMLDRYVGFRGTSRHPVELEDRGAAAVVDVFARQGEAVDRGGDRPRVGGDDGTLGGGGIGDGPPKRLSCDAPDPSKPTMIGAPSSSGRGRTMGTGEARRTMRATEWRDPGR